MARLDDAEVAAPPSGTGGGAGGEDLFGGRGPKPPSDRRTLLSLAAQFVANGFVYSTYLARLPEIRDQTGISISTLGIVLMTGNLVALTASFFTAQVVGRLGSKQVMTGCGVFYVLGLPAIGFSDSLGLLLAAVIGMMLMNVFVDAAMALQASMFSSRRRNPVMNRLWGLFSLGTVGGGLAATSVAGAGVGVTLHLGAMGAVLAVVVLLSGPGLLTSDEHSERQQAGSGGSRWWLGRAALALGIASALAVPLDIVPGEWATFRMTDDLGEGPAAAAVAYFAFALGMTAGRLGGDAVLVRAGALRLAWLGTGVSAAGLVLAATVPSTVSAVAGFCIAGIGISVLSPLLADAAAKAPGPPGSGFKTMFVGDRLAGLLTPLAIGPLAGTAFLDVGAAMLIVVVPSAVLLALVCTNVLRAPR